MKATFENKTPYKIPADSELIFRTEDGKIMIFDDLKNTFNLLILFPDSYQAFVFNKNPQSFENENRLRCFEKMSQFLLKSYNEIKATLDIIVICKNTECSLENLYEQIPNYKEHFRV